MVKNMASTQQSNIDIVRATYENFNGGDVDAVLAAFDEGIEWTEPAGSPYGGTYRGPEAVLENVFGPSMEENDDFEVDAERFVDGGETVVVVGVFRGSNRETGARFDIPFAHVVDLTDGKVSRFVNYTDTATWQETSAA